VNAANPSRQVALVGEAYAGRDFGEAPSSVTDKLDRTPQSQVNDITMRRDSNGSAEHPREVERTTSGDTCERSDFDGFVQMGQGYSF
jgi:hypothetical protein